MVVVLGGARPSRLLEKVPPASTGRAPLFRSLGCLEVLPCEVVRCTQDVDHSVSVDVAGAFGGVCRSSGSCNSCPSVISAGVTPVLRYEKRQYGMNSSHMSYRAVCTNALRRDANDLLVHSVCPLPCGSGFCGLLGVRTSHTQVGSRNWTLGRSGYCRGPRNAIPND